MQDDKRQELLVQTRTAAIALFEDYEHLKQIVSEAETKPTDLRHASAIMRRWLVEDQLRIVANPRVGRIQVTMIDNAPIYKNLDDGEDVLFISGGSLIHGIHIAGLAVNGGPKILPPDYNPEKLIEYNIDTFLRQKVIFIKGTWLTRLQLIKFIANVENGVHSGSIREDWEELLSRFNSCISVTTGPKYDNVDAILRIVTGSPINNESLQKYDPKLVNGTLLELTATLSFLVNSPSVEALIENIKAELA